MEHAKTKELLLKACEAAVKQRIENAKESVARAEEGMLAEGKSSAGDKFETGKEMMQQEMDKAQEQLAKAQKLLSMLSSINTKQSFSTVQKGALVFTPKANFFISESLGKFTIAKNEFITMAPTAPLAQAFLGKSVSEIVQFNQSSYQIIGVF